MSSATEIANLACVYIGTENRITSLDDDRFTARTIKGVWDIQRQATIRDGAWNFAMRRKDLAAESLTDGVPYPWGYAFPLPAQCLRLIEVIDLTEGQYQLEGRNILCDSAGPLYVRYQADVEEPALWDAAFTDAFARRLAWATGTRIAGSTFSEQLAWQEYQAAINAAKRVDARENPPIAQGESSWIEARRSHRTGYYL